MKDYPQIQTPSPDSLLDTSKTCLRVLGSLISISSDKIAKLKEQKEGKMMMMSWFKYKSSSLSSSPLPPISSLLRIYVSNLISPFT